MNITHHSVETAKGRQVAHDVCGNTGLTSRFFFGGFSVEVIGHHTSSCSAGVFVDGGVHFFVGVEVHELWVGGVAEFWVREIFSGTRFL